MYVRSLAGGWEVSAASQHPLGRGTLDGADVEPTGSGGGGEVRLERPPPAISVSVDVKTVRHLVPREAFKRGFAYSSTDAFFFLAHGEGKTKVTFTAACARGVESYVQPQLIFQLD